VLKHARHVLWDWNGTLLDDVEACVAAVNRMLGTRGLPQIDTTQYRDVFDFPVQDYYRRLGFDLPSEDWDAMAHEFHGYYRETSRSAGLRAGSRRVLDGLRRDGVPMSVLSACEGRILRRMMQERGLDGLFEQVAGLDDLYAESKLDAGRRLLEALAEDPREVILVGDTTHDYDVASELGCECILVAGGHQAGWRLRACGCRVVPGLEAIRNAARQECVPTGDEVRV
jgi:phosphoglycolate phosphatase